MNPDLFISSTGSGTEPVTKATAISVASAVAEQTLPFLPKGVVIVIIIVVCNFL